MCMEKLSPGHSFRLARHSGAIRFLPRLGSVNNMRLHGFYSSERRLWTLQTQHKIPCLTSVTILLHHVADHAQAS